MRNLKSTLAKLAAAVSEEAARNAAFAATLDGILGGRQDADSRKATRKSTRKGGRRAPATLDPVDLARDGSDRLRERLQPLELSQLLDIVAEYGMDPGKLVMKWKDPHRVIDRIVEMAVARSTKGDAFRAS